MEYVTWSDLIQYSILIVAIIALTHDMFHNNDNKRKEPPQSCHLERLFQITQTWEQTVYWCALFTFIIRDFC